MEADSVDESRKEEIQRILNEMTKDARIFKIAAYPYAVINLVGVVILWQLDAESRLLWWACASVLWIGWAFFVAVSGDRTRRRLRELKALRAPAGRPEMP